MNTSFHILVADDEPATRLVLRQQLEAGGYVVSEVGSKAALMRRLENGPIDLITLGRHLGKDDGLEVARAIRASHNIPVVLMDKATEEDPTVGLQNDADDHHVTHCLIHEAISCIRSVLRTGACDEVFAAEPRPGATERYRFQAGVLDVQQHELKAPTGELVKLSDAEFELLTMLLRHPGCVLSRDTMMRHLKGRNWSPLERTLDIHIGRLRKKLEPSGEAPGCIRSVRSIGYVFVGDVERVGGPSRGSQLPHHNRNRRL